MERFFSGFEKRAAEFSDKQKDEVRQRMLGAGLGGFAGGVAGVVGNKIFGGMLRKEMGTKLPVLHEMGVEKTYKTISDLADSARAALPPDASKEAIKELSELKSLGDSFMKKHNLVEKGITAKVDRAAMKMGPHYNPASNKIHLSTASPSIALHELGHAADYGGTGGLAKAIARRVAGGAIMGAVPAALIYGDAIKKNIKGTVDDKIVDFINAHPYLTTTVGAGVSPLYSEGKASLLALKHIADERGGKAAINVAKKVLGPAWGTYATAITLPALGTAAGIKMMSKKPKPEREKTSGRKMPALEAFLGAGIPMGIVTGIAAGAKSPHEMRKIENEMKTDLERLSYGKRPAQTMSNFRSAVSNFIHDHPVVIGTAGGVAAGTLAAMAARMQTNDLVNRRLHP